MTYRKPRAKTTLRPILLAVLACSLQIIGIGRESIEMSPTMSRAAIAMYAGIRRPQCPLSVGSQLSANGRHMHAPIRIHMNIQQTQNARTTLAEREAHQYSLKNCCSVIH